MKSTATYPAQAPGRSAALLDHVLVQAAGRDLGDALPLARRPGSGVIFTGDGAVAFGRSARDHGYDGPLLIDRRHYAGSSRLSGSARFSASWLAGQREIGVSAVLTDSGYVGGGDTGALRSVLGQAADAGDDVTAVLPLHPRWLRDDLAILVREVVDHDVPVAVVLEHRRDPLGTVRAVAALVELLRAARSVALLSTDVSALGAIAFGARWAAVGVRSSLRHLYPVGAKTPQRPATSCFVDPLLSMVSVGLLVEAWQASKDSEIWRCSCTACRRRPPGWMLTASPLEVNQHTFELLLERRSRLTRLEPGLEREQSWRSQCAEALERYEQVGRERVGWDLPGYLTAWVRVRSR